MKTYTPDVQPTAAELFRIEMECTDVEVMDVTGISKQELDELKFNEAFKWLEHIGCDSFMQTNFASTPQFWGFWKKEWYKIDREFLTSYYKYYFGNALSWYLTYHHTEGHTMNTEAINASFHSLIKNYTAKR